MPTINEERLKLLETVEWLMAHYGFVEFSFGGNPQQRVGAIAWRVDEMTGKPVREFPPCFTLTLPGAVAKLKKELGDAGPSKS